MACSRILTERRGVTLVESMIAIAVVFIIVSGAAYLIYSTIVQEMNGERIATANNFARERIELLKGQGYANLTEGETSVAMDEDGQEIAGGLYTVKTTVTEEMDPTYGYSLRMKTITVEVSVNRPEQYVLVTQTTTINKRGV